MHIKQLSIVFFSCVLVACVGTPEEGSVAADEAQSSRGDCILERSIRGYTVLDEQNLIVEGSGRRQYHLVLRRRAYGLRHSLGIVFDGTTSRICAGFDEIRYEGSLGGKSDSVRIDSIREISAEEEEDLLIQFGKKEPEIEHTPSPGNTNGADVEELDEPASE
jgi:hypothetical protein